MNWAIDPHVAPSIGIVLPRWDTGPGDTARVPWLAIYQLTSIGAGLDETKPD